jgi:TonB family protein
MKRILLLISVFFISDIPLHAQNMMPLPVYPPHAAWITVESEPYPLQDIEKNTKYPIQAEKDKLTADVIIDGLVDENGVVSQIKIHSSPDTLFDEVARAAFMSTPFYPAIREGKPIPFWYFAHFHFQYSQPQVSVTQVKTITTIDTNGVWEVNQVMQRYEKEQYIRTHPPSPKLIGDIRSILPYPDELRKLNISGRVRFTAVLDTAGAIAGHHIEYSDNPFLEEPVTSAITKMKFEKPPAPSSFSYEISFEGDSVRMW